MKSLTFVLLLFLGIEGWAQAQQAIVTNLNKVSKPLSSSKSYASLSFLKNKRIVLAGESTHGTHEFFTVKNELFKYLVQHCGYRLLGMEMSYSEGVKINHYLQTGQGNIKEIMEKTAFPWWKTEEFMTLLYWIRAFNSTAKSGQKIQFYGVDSGNGITYGFKDLALFFEQYQPNFVPEVLASEIFINGKETWNKKDSVTLKLDAISKQLTVLKQQQKNLKNEDWLMATHTLKLINQNYEYYFANVVYHVRDKHLAENVSYTLNLNGPQSKIFVWAHNAHVSKSNNYYRNQVDKDWQNLKPMGYWLHQFFPKDTYIICFDFGNGTYTRRTPEQKGDEETFERFKVPMMPAASYTTTFDSIIHPTYFINFKDPKLTQQTVNWLRNFKPMRHHYADIDVDMGSDFDGIIFIKNATGSDLFFNKKYQD